MTQKKLNEIKTTLNFLRNGRAATEKMSETDCLEVYGISKAQALKNMDTSIAKYEREIEKAEHPLKGIDKKVYEIAAKHLTARRSAETLKPATATGRTSLRFRSGAWKPPSRKPTKPDAEANKSKQRSPSARRGCQTKGGNSMEIHDQYDQVKALTAVIMELSETGTWTERQVMETLLEILNASELKLMGYGDRVDAYMEKYW